MEATKNDLCAGVATLDYQALITTARIAYRHSLEAIYGHYSVLFHKECSNTKRYLHAKWLEDEASGLVIIAETLSTLLEGLDREEVVIVNKEVKVNG